MSVASIVADWRTKADDMDRSAKNYARSCVKAKAAQLILGAKILRNCAKELEREAGKAGTQDLDADAAPEQPDGTG